VGNIVGKLLSKQLWQRFKKWRRPELIRTEVGWDLSSIHGVVLGSGALIQAKRDKNSFELFSRMPWVRNIFCP
jgi:hypothetical protein